MARSRKPAKSDAEKKVAAYIRAVKTGKRVAGKLEQLAVARYERDLKRRSETGFTFDRAAALRACEFFPLLKHYKGRWAGKPIELEGWQLFILWNVFGWKRADGTRRFRTVYQEVARKQGKTTVSAGVGLYLAFFDGEPGADVYAAATKRDQARICHGDAVRMVQASPGLGIQRRRDNLHVLETASKFEPLGADADTMDGLNVHAAIVDEFHAHRTREVLDRLETGVGARTQPLIWIITTAGDDQQSPCFIERERARLVLEDVNQDDTLFAIIFSPEPGDDWTDPRTWSKGNPNLGVSVTVENLTEECRSAQQSPAKQNAFRRFRLNEWTRTTTRFLDLAKWDACSGIELGAAPQDWLAGRDGMLCYGGLDLSSKTDLTALALVFPPEESDGFYEVGMRFWVPEEGIYERAKKDGVPYDRWADEGWIVATPGPVIDYEFILAELEELSKRFRIHEVAYDRWGAQSITPQLEDLGLTMVEFGQGYRSMSDPTKELERLVLSGKLRHGGHPVLRWNADCLEIQTDPAGNIKPVKPDVRKNSKRIDGAVALIMGLARAMLLGAAPPDERSVYEERGLRTL